MFAKLKHWSVVRHDRLDEANQLMEETTEILARNRELEGRGWSKTSQAASRRTRDLERTLAEVQQLADLAENGYALWDDGANVCRAEYSNAEYHTLVATKHVRPVVLCSLGSEVIWWFEDSIYRADHDLTSDDVVALVREGQNKRRLRLEKAHALQAMGAELGKTGQRQSIPQDVKVFVWQRDRGRCVECGKQEKLEFDHVIPLAMGGSNTARNLQLLCDDCNRRKGATLG